MRLGLGWGRAVWGAGLMAGVLVGVLVVVGRPLQMASGAPPFLSAGTLAPSGISLA